MHQYIWPNIFITGELPPNPNREKLIADALCGWANAHAGAEPPDNFGIGMQKIGEFIKTGILLKDLQIEADKIIKEKRLKKSQGVIGNL
jgi:hypothetical protein